MVLYNMPQNLTDYPLVELPSTCMPGSFCFSSKLADFPTPTGNVIDLPAGSTWYILGTVDLAGNRLNCLGNVTILGTSSETSFLISTGLPTAEALFTSAYTLPIQNITLGCPADTLVFNLDSDSTNGLDLKFTNFGSTSVICGSLGYIKDYSNVNLDSCAILNSTGGFTFDGSIGTIGITNSIFSSAVQTGSYLNLPNTLTILRRFRMNLCSLVCFTSGIDFQTSNVPNNGFILNIVNFSGPGTKVNISSQDNRAQFTGCIGIANSASIGSLRITDNVTTTTVASTNVWYNVAGASILLNSSRFTAPTNSSLQYVGAQTQQFSITGAASLSSANNVDIGFTFTLNGADADTYAKHLSTSGNGKLDNITTTAILELNTNDIIQAQVENRTSANNILVEDMSMTIFQINT